MAKTVLKGGYLLTFDTDIGDLTHGDILIEDEKIESIDRNLEVGDAEVIRAEGMIIMPGLVDAHLHTWQTVLRAMAGDWSLFEYGRHIHTNLGLRFTPDDIYLSTLVGALNQLNHGVTTIFDWCHNNPTPEHSDGAIEALGLAGIRAVFGHGTPKPQLNEGGVPTAELFHPESEVKRLRKGRLASDQALVTMAMCIRGPDLASYEACAHDLQLARRYGLLASAHIGGRMPFNRKTPDGLVQLSRANLLGPDFNAVHANKLSDEELQLLIDAGASITVTPEVEMQMGHGLPVTGRVLALGGRPSVGVDVESSTGASLLHSARLGLQVQRCFDNMAVNHRGEEVEQVSIQTRQALEWATIEGARALRLDQRIGSLTPGKLADIIMIRTDRLGVAPASEPANTVLYHVDSADIDTVLVAGRAVKRRGELLATNVEQYVARLTDANQRLREGYSTVSPLVNASSPVARTS